MVFGTFHPSVLYALGENVSHAKDATPKISTAQSMMNGVILDLLKRDVEDLKKIKSYHCTFIKQEMFDGKLNHEETINYYFWTPCRIYMKWTNKQDKGLTAVYDCQKDKNHFYGKDSGIAGYFGFMKLTMNSPFIRVFHPNHWQIDQSDLFFIINMIFQQMQDSIKLGKFRLTSIREMYDHETDVDTLRFDAVLTDLPVNGVSYGKVSIWVDANTLIPVKFLLYNVKGELYERYILKDMELNVDPSPELFAPVK